MEYTKNYHLPQWAEEDRIMMEDFNGAMASIEGGLSEGYGDRRKPVDIKTFFIDANTAANSTVLTFDFEPSFLIIGHNRLSCIKDSGTITIEVSAYKYDVSFKIVGNSLIMTQKDSRISSYYSIKCIAFR